MESTISDMDIEAFVDGELDPAAADMVRAALTGDVGLRRRYDCIVRQKQLLIEAFTGEGRTLH